MAKESCWQRSREEGPAVSVETRDAHFSPLPSSDINLYTTAVSQGQLKSSWPSISTTWKLSFQHGWKTLWWQGQRKKIFWKINLLKDKSFKVNSSIWNFQRIAWRNVFIGKLALSCQLKNSETPQEMFMNIQEYAGAHLPPNSLLLAPIKPSSESGGWCQAIRELKEIKLM